MLKNFGFWLLIGLIVLNFFAVLVLDLYRFWFFDVIMHFLGGVGVYFVSRQYFAKALKNASWFESALLLLCTVVLVGTFWEFTEYSVTGLWKSKPPDLQIIGDLDDTIKDLMMDAIGGVFVAILHFFRHRKTQKA